jgi:ribonuclease BN (tRNA processing enzyme)
VDCGWYSAVRLQECGLHILKLRTLFFTHLHQDHYTGLAGLLYARSMRGHREGQPPPLRIVGPAADLGRVVELTRSFLQAERVPEVWPELDLQPIEPGTPYKDEDFEIHTFPSQHAIIGMCGRFTDRHTGVVIGFTGDTGPKPGLAEFFRGANLLIHEASIPPNTPDSELRGDHSRATDAASVALAARVKRLRLIHLRETHRDESLVAARAIFPETELATEGERITLP